MTSTQLRIRRLALGWSREHLAQNLGVPLSMVSEWETGMRVIDREGNIERIFSLFEPLPSVRLSIKKKAVPGREQDPLRASRLHSC